MDQPKNIEDKSLRRVSLLISSTTDILYIYLQNVCKNCTLVDSLWIAFLEYKRTCIISSLSQNLPRTLFTLYYLL